MGHMTGSGDRYDVLEQRLIQKVQANIGSPTLLKILRILFSPRDAELAAKLPHNLTPVTDLSRRLAMPVAELNERLTAMAHRGLVFDLECRGERYVTLPPVVIGFFEFVFMRTRPDLPMRELAQLFEEYFTENDGALPKSFWQGQTQLSRTFVREEALPLLADSQAEILDWERASYIVASATAIAVGVCQCHHLAQHLGTACDKPREVCLTFNYAAESMARNGQARAITKDEARRILTLSKEAKLIQVGDNVQHKVSFICNCCGCCCHLLRGVKTYHLNKSIVSSNWIVTVDDARCKGCGECAKRCPLGAMRMEVRQEEGRTGRVARCHEASCLGCGLCAETCQSGAAVMRPRPQRVLVPETIFDQRLAMAIERGRLADMLFDDPTRLSHRALGRIVAALEKTEPFKALMAADAMKSAFLKALVAGAKLQAGKLSRVLV